MQKLFSFLTLAILTLALSGGFSQALADCQTLYGGGQTCTTNYSFTVNKMVQVPGKGGGGYVNNLSINDAKYSPSQNVNFEVVVTNTGSQVIPTINVTDTFPQFLTFVSGIGNYNQSNNTLNFTVSNLNPGQNVTYILTAKTADSNLLPADQGVICMSNQIVGVDNNGVANSSASQFCVQKSVLGASQPQVFTAPKIVNTPATGPEMLPLLALLPGGLGGLMLRKKSNKMTSIHKGGEK
jgi:uncharacterized repeat protein (TIGR01451 family)